MGEGIWQLKGRSSFFGTKNLSLEQVSCLNSAGSKELLPFYFYTFRQHLRGFAERLPARLCGVCYLTKVLWGHLPACAMQPHRGMNFIFCQVLSFSARTCPAIDDPE